MNMNKKKFPEGFFTKDRPIAKPRYIDAELAKNKIDDMEVKYGRDDLDSEACSLLDKYDVIDSLDEIPSADVQPVVHAHWKYDKNGVFWCSRCECIPATKSYFCPNCGAKMDGDEHER